MGKRQTMRRNTALRRTKLREWREFRHMTLEEVAERLEALDMGAPTTHASLSRVEKALIPYSQRLLEGLALIYRTDVANLLVRDPKDEDGLWSAYEKATPSQRRQIAELAKTIIRTGT